MNAKILFFVLLVAPWTCASTQAEESRSVWMLVAGGDTSKCWWTVQKLRSFPAAEAGLYRDPATLEIVLLGTLVRDFGDQHRGGALAVDGNTVRQNTRCSIEIKAGQSMQTIVEHEFSRLFATKDARLVLELPLMSTFYRTDSKPPAPRLSRFETYIDSTTTVLRIISRPTNRQMWNKLVKQMLVNRHQILGGEPAKDLHGFLPSEALAEILEKSLGDLVPGLVISYSKRLDTFFFSLPSTSDEAFTAICRDGLSNSHW